MKLLETGFKSNYSFIIIEEELHGDLLYLFIDDVFKRYAYWENLYNSDIKIYSLVVDEFFDYMAGVGNAEQKS